jgi:hypothetical protein
MKGIPLSSLFHSDVFNYTFDFDEWPSSHPNDTLCSKPYVGNFFELRNKYETIFAEKEFGEEDNIEANKLNKIKYQINLLPKMS